MEQHWSQELLFKVYPWWRQPYHQDTLDPPQTISIPCSKPEVTKKKRKTKRKAKKRKSHRTQEIVVVCRATDLDPSRTVLDEDLKKIVD
jgi:hypothetical protein